MTQIAGKAVVQTGVQDDTKKGARAVENRFKKLAAKISRLSRKAATMAAAIGTPLIIAAKQFAATGDKIDKLSKRTNLSTDAVQSFGFAMEQSGKSVESLEPAIKAMNRNFLDFQRGSKEAKDNFAALNIDFAKFEELDTAERFRMILHALEQIPDAGQRAALANKVLGRSGTDVLPLIGNLQSLEKEFDKLGTKMSKEQVAEAAAMTDAFNKLGHQLKAIVVQAGEALAPALTKLAEQIGPVIKRVIAWVKNNKEWIVTAGEVALALGGVSVALKAISIAMSTNPFMLMAAGAAAAIPVINKLAKSTNNVGGLLGPKSAIGHDDTRDQMRGRVDLTANDPRHIARNKALSASGASGILSGVMGSGQLSGSKALNAQSRAKGFSDLVAGLKGSFKDIASAARDTIEKGSNLAANGIGLAATFGNMQQLGPMMQSVSGGFGQSAFSGTNGAATPMDRQIELQQEMKDRLEKIDMNIEGLRNEGLGQ